MPIDPLELLLFTTDAVFARQAERAGVDGFLVDWETRGKVERQSGRDMEINTDTADDLARLVEAVQAPVTVRINGLGPESHAEIDLAISIGAARLMLPMARTADEVARFLDLVNGRARTIVQIETQQLIDDLKALAGLPWDAAYIGLHDLMLSRAASSMWHAVLDGTVEQIFRRLGDRRVGFAGATVIGGGHPIRFTQILQELARLGAQLTFLRRSFRREIQDRDLTAEIDAIRATWIAARLRGPDAIESDRTMLFSHLERLVEA
jgi:2-keto-3-deoxy-L-rhamnonate aldolase RhmA